MSKVRSTNTKVELMVFRYLRSEGIYFQRHYLRVVGTPDIALPKKKVAVFIDGDFWHGRTYNDIVGKLPEYWKNKIARNIARDRRNRATLRKQGWRVLRVWESSLNSSGTRQRQLEKIAAVLRSEHRLK